ncbi:hypothetical protein D7Y39_01820 [Stenotrophomonas maltophilia]|uniref:AbiTii domain-containing protein n=1 Tax=Stenotrophomonas maltophilia TaxID=40324 RepID=UPI0015DF9E56|nr:hypothetical protein [Stenotrophomonas maltophilia]MBA0288579.1 hypothetical protein [Stenotrophomonas maltophilia]
MGSLVHEIQLDAANAEVSVSALLRKALIVSTKLNVFEDVAWIKAELSGYGDGIGVEIPVYRQLRGTPQVRNPYHGYIPLQMPPETQEALCKVSLNFSAAEIEAVLNQKDGNVRLTFSAKVTDYLLRSMDVPMQPVLSFSASAFVKVLDCVRNRVLQWALDLESAGVLGDGLSFTPVEVQAAQQVTHNTITIGTMNNSQLQQLSSGSQSLRIEEHRQQLSSFLADIKEAAAVLGHASQASVDADTVLVQLQSAKPNRSIIEASLKSLRSVLEGAAGGALAEYIPRLVALMAAIGVS